MAAIRNIMLQCGLIQAQVSLVKATDERTKVEFKQVHDCGKDAQGNDLGLHTVQRKAVCSGCAKELAQADIKKGFEAAKGVFKEMPQATLDGIRVPTNGALVIQEIVSADFFLSNPTLLTGDAYFLTPPAKEKYPPTAYKVIMEALRGSVAMARTSMYNREYTAAISVGQHGLVMHFVRYPSELRAEPLTNLPAVDPSYVAMAKQVFDNMRSATPKLDYVDSYNEGVADAVAKLVAGVTPVSMPAAPAPVATQDLANTLKAMLAMGKTGAPAQEPPKAEEPVAEQAPAKTKKAKKTKVA